MWRLISSGDVAIVSRRSCDLRRLKHPNCLQVLRAHTRRVLARLRDQIRREKADAVLESVDNSGSVFKACIDKKIEPSATEFDFNSASTDDTLRDDPSHLHCNGDNNEEDRERSTDVVAESLSGT